MAQVAGRSVTQANHKSPAGSAEQTRSDPLPLSRQNGARPKQRARSAGSLAFQEPEPAEDEAEAQRPARTMQACTLHNPSSTGASRVTQVTSSRSGPVGSAWRGK